ncbi:hypothetical protein ABL78_4657 [Leptomonas seymouri]|uniref:Uncharacterized protein n=1 Tax=Leptomonas seymouri TaxID=5684 RepID=A0A0N1HXW3_LEPSE|nr:hypothetical protein ABL78_4657 [Leptomonas seymouri]|eukprot:KPI86274.1 hypothetical protein ABL78_4657 [Leptomonas seymouri]
MHSHAHFHSPYFLHKAPMPTEPKAEAASFCNWKLTLDGAAYQNSCSNSCRGSAKMPSQGQRTRAERLPQRVPPLPRTAARERHGAPQQQQQQQSSDPLSLTPWEAKAVQVYRGLRRSRQCVITALTSATSDKGVTSQRSSLKDHVREGPRDASEELAVALSIVPMLVSAFPSSVRRNQCHKNMVSSPDTSNPLSALPQALVLQYFLHIGYPLQVTRAGPALGALNGAGGRCQAYTTLLITAAEHVVRWFHSGGLTEHAPGACAPPRTLSLDLLPDVVKQMVVAHHMSVHTAALWVVRVYVGLMTSEGDRYVEEQHRLYGKSRSAVPAWPLSPTCLENIHLLAETMRDAVYRLQGNVLPMVHLDERATCQGLNGSLGAKEDDEGGHYSIDNNRAPGVGEDGAVRTSPSKASAEREEWKYFHLLVLQQAFSLLRGCLADPTHASEHCTKGPCSHHNGAESLRSVQLEAPTADLVALRPSVSTSYTVLEGLVRLVYSMRIKYDLYASARLYRRTDREGKSAFFTPTRARGIFPQWPELSSEKRVMHVLEKQWVAFAEAAVRDLGDLVLNYLRFVPLLTAALEIR